MKHFFLIALFAALVSFSSATIWHVNNNPGVFTDFTQLQEAHNSASVVSGDTLYVYGSSIQYNDVSLNSKTLTIIGPGYFLGGEYRSATEPPAGKHQFYQYLFNCFRHSAGRLAIILS